MVIIFIEKFKILEENIAINIKQQKGKETLVYGFTTKINFDSKCYVKLIQIKWFMFKYIYIKINSIINLSLKSNFKNKFSLEK